jgi:mannose-1-phosphate guanylyltransferase
LKVIIMAGGKGTRFWPRSTERFPKQFLKLTSEETMLQVTYKRFAKWLPTSSIYVLTASRYSHLVIEQLPQLAADQLIIEPDQRDTGPCTAFTAMHFLAAGDDEVMVFVPSDHFISGESALREALVIAEKTASVGRTIATLGIIPTRPETGYGYIESDGELSEGSFQVKRFIEKPDEENARRLLLKGNVFWNSGIFVWKPSTIAYYMKIYARDIWEPLLEARKIGQNAVFETYKQLLPISIDIALLEKADVIRVLPIQFEWDDVGTWSSLERIRSADSDGNILYGDINTSSSTECIVYTEDIKTIVIGAEQLIIVLTSEGLLICHKSKEHEIKRVLKQLESDRGAIR